MKAKKKAKSQPMFCNIPSDKRYYVESIPYRHVVSSMWIFAGLSANLSFMDPDLHIQNTTSGLSLFILFKMWRATWLSVSKSPPDTDPVWTIAVIIIIVCVSHIHTQTQRHSKQYSCQHAQELLMNSDGLSQAFQQRF